MVLRISGDPLSPRNLKAVARELDETAVAVSVVGTSHHKLRELAALTDPIADSLHGDRREAVAMRSRLRRLAHNVGSSVTGAGPASDAIRSLADGVREVMDMVRGGVGVRHETPGIPPFLFVNDWGYTEDEVRSALPALREAGKALDAVGLMPTDLSVSLEDGRHGYDRMRDTLIIDPQRTLGADDVLAGVADWLWRRFGPDEIEVWGGGEGGNERFATAFARSLLGRSVDPEAAARLETTVGRIADRWPEVA